MRTPEQLREMSDGLRDRAAEALGVIVGEGFQASASEFVDCIVQSAVLEVLAVQRQAEADAP